MYVYDRYGKFPFVVISGTSGTGKDWLVQKLGTKRFEQVKTFADREPRNDGKEFYNFVSKEEMDEIFPSFCQVFVSGDSRYGCREEDFMKIIKKGKIPVLILTPGGLTGMIEKLGKDAEKFSIFYVHIDAHPDEQMFNLLKLRKADPKHIADRTLKMDIEIKAAFENFLEEDSIDFLNTSVGNEFETASSSNDALDIIMKQFYLGIDGEI